MSRAALVVALGALAACAAPVETIPTSPPPAPVEPVIALTPPPVPEREAAPAFAFPVHGDTTAVFTPERFAGRFVLVDFWASWCGPCFDEIPRLAAVHEEFGPDGLEVLSVSLDLFASDVDAFRQRVAPMPWHHAFVGERFDHPSVAAFGVDRLPEAVLIGPDGTIRARGGHLRRDLLRITIERELRAHHDATDAP